MIEALGCPALPHSRGRSLLPLARGEKSNWENIAFSEFCQDASGGGGPFPEEGLFQRMVRLEEWKLNYYHGQPVQLFNLKEDPYELNDRANDPSCKEIVDGLTQRILDDWDPATIAEKMAALRKDQAILTPWARNTKPEDRFRWDLRPGMSYLDD